MRISKRLRIHKTMGYILLVLYAVSVGVLPYSKTVNMLLNKYMVMIGVVMIILGFIFAIMQERIAMSFIVGVPAFVILLDCALGHL